MTIFVASELNRRITLQLARQYGSDCVPVMLRADCLHEVVRFFKRRMHPRVRRVIARNSDLLRSFDALVFTDRNPLGRALRGPKLIHSGHGVGDRHAGIFPELLEFDYLLVPGPDRWRRMVARGYVWDERGAVIGSPKMDLIRSRHRGSHRLFSDDKPVVLYNPHFNRRESSWHQLGEQILEYFYASRDYNLVFAPHALLFAKQCFRSKRYQGAKNILIDTGSPALIDMSYTCAADIYVGDVSSQVYEFVGWRQRPCIFLRTHNEAWQGNEAFAMWRMGQVVDGMAEFDTALRCARGTLPAYLAEQQRLVADRFMEGEGVAAKRGARAIAEYLSGCSAQHQPYPR